MAEETKPETTPAAPVSTPTSTTPATPTIDLNEFETTKKERDELKKNWEQAKPVLEVVYKDPEAMAAATKAWNKAHGITETPATEIKKEEPTSTATPSAIETDNRNALVSRTVTDFEKEHGLDKLGEEEKRNLNVAIINEIKEILDPMGTGKSGSQLLEGVPLTKLPGILNRAYLLATREDRESKIAEAAKSGVLESATGLIGSISSGGAPKAEEVTLTQSEKVAAKKMHMSEEDYLKNKIEIGKRNGSIY